MILRLWTELRENGRFSIALMVAMAVCTIIPVYPELGGGILIAIVTIGSGFFGTAPLAREFAEGTMSSLLSQPISRSRIWLEKWIAAVACWLPLTGLYFLCAPIVQAGIEPASVSKILFFNLMVFLAGPFMALLTRSVLAAFLYACVTPIVIVVFYLVKDGEFSGESMFGHSLAVGLGFFISSFVWFLRCEDKPSLLGAQIRLPTADRGTEKEIQTVGTVLDRSIQALLLKEFRLALPFIFLSTMLSLLMLLLGFLLGWLNAPNELYGILVVVWLVSQIIVIPSLFGVASVMADRVPGIREQQMTAPGSMALQWNVKLFVCLLVTSTIVLPLTIVPALVVTNLDPSEYWRCIPEIIVPIACVYLAPRAIRTEVGVKLLMVALAILVLALPIAMTSLSALVYFRQEGWETYFSFVVAPVSISFVVLFMGFYAGSICRTHFSAMCSVVLFVLSAVFFIGLLAGPFLGSFRFDFKVAVIVFEGLLLAACLVIGARLSYSNLRWLKTRREIGVQLGCIAIALATVALLVLGIDYLRAG